MKRRELFLAGLGALLAPVVARLPVKPVEKKWWPNPHTNPRCTCDPDSNILHMGCDVHKREAVAAEKAGHCVESHFVGSHKGAYTAGDEAYWRALYGIGPGWFVFYEARCSPKPWGGRWMENGKWYVPRENLKLWLSHHPEVIPSPRKGEPIMSSDEWADKLLASWCEGCGLHKQMCECKERRA